MTTTTTADTNRWGKIPAWWLDHPDLDADGFAVLAALATFADENGLCWPSQSTLAAKLKRSRPTINRILQGLSDIGLVSIEHRRGRDGARLSCLYRIRFVRDEEVIVEVDKRPVQTVDKDDSLVNAPCPSPIQEQVQSNKIPDPLTSRERMGLRDVPLDWMPSEDDMAWARTRHTEVDLGCHVEAFILRCQAHGYRYRDISAAWRAWLVQDVAAGKAPIMRSTPFARASTLMPARARETAAEQRFGAWAAAAAELRQRAVAASSSWS